MRELVIIYKTKKGKTMAEPITLGAGALIWEYGLKPIADSIKKEYGEETKKLLKSGIEKVFEKLPFYKKEVEIIEAEIIDTDVITLTDKSKFLEFIQNNQQIVDILNEANNREPNISVVIEKSYNEILIDGNNNSITF